MVEEELNHDSISVQSVQQVDVSQVDTSSLLENSDASGFVFQNVGISICKFK